MTLFWPGLLKDSTVLSFLYLGGAGKEWTFFFPLLEYIPNVKLFAVEQECFSG